PQHSQAKCAHSQKVPRIVTFSWNYFQAVTFSYHNAALYNILQRHSGLTVSVRKTRIAALRSPRTMTLSTRIAPHLPYLRRFSRALTGSQASGDAYVAATLEALIADISIFPPASADRIALYRLFCNLYKTASIQIPEPASE